jgi:hypothetical protein
VRVISLEDLAATMPGATDEEVLAEHARIVMEAIKRDHDESAETDDETRAARLAGKLCACCDKPLPADWSGPDCAGCADLAA